MVLDRQVPLVEMRLGAAEAKAAPQHAAQRQAVGLPVAAHHRGRRRDEREPQTHGTNEEVDVLAADEAELRAEHRPRLLQRLDHLAADQDVEGSRAVRQAVGRADLAEILRRRRPQEVDVGQPGRKDEAGRQLPDAQHEVGAGLPLALEQAQEPVGPRQVVVVDAGDERGVLRERRRHGAVARERDAALGLLDEMQGNRQTFARPVADRAGAPIGLVVDHDDEDLARIERSEIDAGQRVQEPRQVV